MFPEFQEGFPKCQGLFLVTRKRLLSTRENFLSAREKGHEEVFAIETAGDGRKFYSSLLVTEKGTSGTATSISQILYYTPFFKASALWADAFYKSKCLSVCL